MPDARVLRKLSNIKVLVVEDDDITLMAIKQSLSFYCKQVITATNGLEGFEKFEQFKPDVVIADINMPEMNGLEMVQSMHDICPHLPVIIMTSYDSSENMIESINQRVYSYLRKPIKIEELQIALLMATKDIYNSTIYLQDDFHYHCDTQELFNKNSLVKLTKTEKKLFHLLCSNANKILDFMTIESFVWEDKEMSVEALRMCVKKIRAKTHPKIIENVQGCGYRINSKKE